MDLRRRRKPGPQLIQAELLRLHNCRLSTSTIWKVLHRNHAKLLQRRRDTRPKRYSRKVPGECVQLDTRKIAPGIYQYTAVDDSTRLRVLGMIRAAPQRIRFTSRRAFAARISLSNPTNSDRSRRRVLRHSVPECVAPPLHQVST